MSKFPAIVAVLLLFSPLLASAETLRCGNKIVDTGMSMDDVRKFCGKASSEAVEEHDVRSGNRVVGTTQVHIWTYNRASGQDAAVLAFDQGKLLSITYKRK